MGIFCTLRINTLIDIKTAAKSSPYHQCVYREMERYRFFSPLQMWQG